VEVTLVFMDFDQKPAQPETKPQQAAPVEDVFADTLPETPSQTQRVPEWVSTTQPMQKQEETVVPQRLGGFNALQRKRIAILAGAGVALILLVIFGPVLWTRAFGSRQSEAIANINQVRPLTNTTIPTRTNRVVPTERVDSDGDGLTDEEEKTTATNSRSIDSDNDGLTDKQEVKVYNTNPNKSDSDGDGFTDGDEVKHFYNPNGSGKLINVNEAIQSFENTNVNQ